MKNLIVILFFCITGIAYAQQEKGIHFEHGISWNEIKAKARAQNKYIFVDAFTTWCGPCRMMSATIFPMESVGTFFNANFINAKVQLDTTKADNEEVKKWYKDAADIKNMYKVNVFPTYLFFSPQGELVHRAVGSSDAATFIAKAQAALSPEKQYYTLKGKYDAGNKDPEFLRLLSSASLEAYDRDFSGKVINEYLHTQKDLLTPENLKLLVNATSSSKDPGFAVFRENGAKADSILGKGTSADIIKRIALMEVVYPEVYKSGDQQVNWKAISTMLDNLYPDLSSEIILSFKARYFQSKKNWPEFNKAVTEYINKFSDKINNMELNNFAWTVFENCDDGACVEAALAWSKQSLSGVDEKNTMFMDTYANLLYKAGKKEEAIKVEQEAVLLSKDDASVKATLEKMKKGEKTW